MFLKALESIPLSALADIIKTSQNAATLNGR